jgi:hypothetical protein
MTTVTYNRGATSFGGCCGVALFTNCGSVNSTRAIINNIGVSQSCCCGGNSIGCGGDYLVVKYSGSNYWSAVGYQASSGCNAGFGNIRALMPGLDITTPMSIGCGAITYSITPPSGYGSSYSTGFSQNYYFVPRNPGCNFVASAYMPNQFFLAPSDVVGFSSSLQWSYNKASNPPNGTLYWDFTLVNE